MIYSAATLTKAGPRKINEDTIGVWTLNPERLYAVVADGLGGMGGGSRASKLAIELLEKDLSEDGISQDTMIRSAKYIHENILEAQASEPSFKNMATTLTAVSLFRNHMTGVHCGDTRASIARGRGIKRLTVDHSEGERLFRAGKLTKEELFEYPRKHILDSALGIHKPPEIEGFSFVLQSGDKIFLTTDGVHQKVLLQELREVSLKYNDPGLLVEEVGALIETRKPDDNYSMVAIFVF
jgi:serine/threonine protein phosphatase PrpC